MIKTARLNYQIHFMNPPFPQKLLSLFYLIQCTIKIASFCPNIFQVNSGFYQIFGKTIELFWSSFYILWLIFVVITIHILISRVFCLPIDFSSPPDLNLFFYLTYCWNVLFQDQQFHESWNILVFLLYEN